jgi:hypothetical protein
MMPRAVFCIGALAANGVHSATRTAARVIWASGIVRSIDQGSSDMDKPKEAEIKALREARSEMIKRTEKNRALIKGKLKLKAVGQVVSIKASKGRGQ